MLTKNSSIDVLLGPKYTSVAIPQVVFNYSKLAIETLKQGVEYNQC